MPKSFLQNGNDGHGLSYCFRSSSIRSPKAISLFQLYTDCSCSGSYSALFINKNSCCFFFNKDGKFSYSSTLLPLSLLLSSCFLYNSQYKLICSNNKTAVQSRSPSLIRASAFERCCPFLLVCIIYKTILLCYTVAHNLPTLLSSLYISYCWRRLH